MSDVIVAKSNGENIKVEMALETKLYLLLVYCLLLPSPLKKVALA